MAFYFALLNVSKKEERSSDHRSSRRRRRHSIASVESPLLDYRLLPRPQVLDGYLEDDVAAPCCSTSNGTEQRRRTKYTTKQPSSSHSQTDIHREMKEPDKQTLSRSKKMIFQETGERKKDETRRELPRTTALRGRNTVLSSKKDTGKNKPTSKIPIATRGRSKGKVPPNLGIREFLVMSVDNIATVRREMKRRPSPQLSTTSESRRSSALSSTSTRRREDSPASSVDSHRENTMSASVLSNTMKLSALSMDPPVKKVTFSSSPYVISNSFLGDRAVLVRRGSGTAVLQTPIFDEVIQREPLVFANTKVLAPHDEVCGGDWWTPCDEKRSTTITTDTESSPTMVQDTTHDNRINRVIEISKSKRCRLLRRRSTSDKTKILAYRNSGFMTASEERGSQMSCSMDRPCFF